MIFQKISITLYKSNFGHFLGQKWKLKNEGYKQKESDFKFKCDFFGDFQILC